MLDREITVADSNKLWNILDWKFNLLFNLEMMLRDFSQVHNRLTQEMVSNISLTNVLAYNLEGEIRNSGVMSLKVPCGANKP